MFHTLLLNEREEDYEHDPTLHIKFLKQRNHELQQYWIQRNNEIKKMWREETDKLKEEIEKLKEEKQKYQPKGSRIDPEGLHDYMKEEIEKLKEEEYTIEINVVGLGWCRYIGEEDRDKQVVYCKNGLWKMKGDKTAKDCEGNYCETDDEE